VAPALGLAIKWWHSSSLPCLPRTELAIFAEQVIKNYWVASLAGKILNVGLVMLMHASIASCMILVIRDLLLYPCSGSSSSFYKM
jgi:hypothetical protein